MKPRLGIYEKALPAALDWPQRFEMAAGLALILLKSPLTKAPSARPGCAGTGAEAGVRGRQN